jgi:hypothetical protein
MPGELFLSGGWINASWGQMDLYVPCWSLIFNHTVFYKIYMGKPRIEIYRKIPSLRYYLLVHPDQPKIEAFSRKGEEWLQSIHYQEIDLPPFYFKVEDFYGGLEF